MFKSLKKIGILFLLLLLSSLLFLSSCNTAEVDSAGYATVVVANGDDVKEFSVPLSKIESGNGAFGALDYLSREGTLTYQSQDGAYGKYLTAVGELRENAAEGKYIGIWTSVEGDFDTSAYATSVSYLGKTLYSSGVGISQMSLTDGCTIYFGEISYG